MWREAARQIVALADNPSERGRLSEAGLRRAATWPDEDDVADDLVGAPITDVARDRRYKGFWNSSGGFHRALTLPRRQAGGPWDTARNSPS